MVIIDSFTFRTTEANHDTPSRRLPQSRPHHEAGGAGRHNAL
ncbi:MAG: hypothetical protein V8Q84_01660 [Bilophila sp.]